MNKCECGGNILPRYRHGQRPAYKCGDCGRKYVPREWPKYVPRWLRSGVVKFDSEIA